MSDQRQSPSVIEAADLTIGWNSPVISNASFTIPRGGVTVLIGPNGSGKSTLLHAITGLLQPLSGSVQVLGSSPEKVQAKISYVAQHVNVPYGIPLTVKATVAMGRYASVGWLGRMKAEDHRQIQLCMEKLDLMDLSHRHLGELSGGQRQRVLVAQGIAQEHQILVLDEPLTGLDIGSMRTIDTIIHEETDDGRTVVLTSHNLEEARAADYVLLLGGGQLLAGEPSQILTTANLQAAYGLGVHPPKDDLGLELPTPH